MPVMYIDFAVCGYMYTKAFCLAPLGGLTAANGLLQHAFCHLLLQTNIANHVVSGRMHPGDFIKGVAGMGEFRK
jgi:hypothetical protein